MDQKKYQVFVSSTFDDLQEERQVVMRVLLKMGYIPSGMELFPAADEDLWSLIRGVIDDCDYYVVIIAGRYGSTDDNGISFTEKEYLYAIKTDKPVIAFLHKDPGSIPNKKTELTDPGRKKLKKFQEHVECKACEYWENPYELGVAVASSLDQLRKNRPAIGWIRGDKVQQANDKEILQLRNENDNLRKELLEIQKESPIGIEEIAKGDDIVEIKTHAVYKEFILERPEIKTFRHTWNEIFFTVSPLMIQEASESEIAKALSDKLRPNFPSSKENKGGLLSDALELGAVEIDQEIFHTIIVQFLNLGLIKESVRKRSVKDTAKYWRLTKSGKNAMNKLRLIRRPENSNGNGCPS